VQTVDPLINNYLIIFSVKSPSMQSITATAAASRKQSYTMPMLIIGALFFIFGFVTWANGTLIPYLKIACELTTKEALLVTFAFYISYAVMAFPSSWVLKKTVLKGEWFWVC
jgi:fucose permease